ncbi:phage replisome organizer N-terminal domain-containing protein [Streptococcus ruminantium]|uniref:Phage replisome organizer N-terminal domain-containing protein n=1 Tax=Streptococcus ruminantium TaxID=1917441 RepID=A0ABU1B7F6_9STRE|nr:phage replisome organizer N-terminal domain-containing protein [Streptococcus ruminantium]MDQ8760230.1 phage replisome organizer N-terminal domain-containing protein [Streptococcus ruminantium]MDQ8765743.1 phage replisome organizer N-terminal domain-containing protein [Streptococcus ruminantium]MDQ8769819.1 phage replisome organizer N-terminal domain-containing protein [Streptococcus ruminantium]MDQ8775588.1 phage replisome organizer N-terminal domain-containing protein [Streptococcus rumina
MAKTKIYFWLKIDKKFFDNIFIKRLKTIPGGYTMTVIYIRLMLESLESDCILYYEGYFENLKEELALKLDVSEDDIDMTMAYFTKCGLIQIDEDQNAELPQAKAMVMSETNWASYKREQRQNKERLDNVQKSLTNSNSCPTEIELEKELELEQQQEEKNAVAGAGKNLIFEKLKEAFGEMSISGTITQEAEDLLKVHGQRLVLYALDETILNGGRSIRYTRSILERWQGQGLKTIEQVKQNKVEFEAMKQPRQDNPDNFPEVPF